MHSTRQHGRGPVLRRTRYQGNHATIGDRRCRSRFDHRGARPRRACARSPCTRAGEGSEQSAVTDTGCRCVAGSTAGGALGHWGPNALRAIKKKNTSSVPRAATLRPAKPGRCAHQLDVLWSYLDSNDDSMDAGPSPTTARGHGTALCRARGERQRSQRTFTTTGPGLTNASSGEYLARCSSRERAAHAARLPARLLRTASTRCGSHCSTCAAAVTSMGRPSPNAHSVRGRARDRRRDGLDAHPSAQPVGAPSSCAFSKRHFRRPSMRRRQLRSVSRGHPRDRRQRARLRLMRWHRGGPQFGLVHE